MTLNFAHEGYEYQDLITSFFILKNMLSGRDCKFSIDRKNIEDSETLDKFDDLVIISDNTVERKQFKYSNKENAKKITKNDLANDSSSNLALDTLFNSWKELRSNNQITDFRLCLAWDEPVDDILDVLIEVKSLKYSFEDIKTKIYQIDYGKLWPQNGQPLATWRRFKSKSETIVRDEFINFCNDLIIEVNFPKASLDITEPGDLEKIILELVSKLGVGIYPNEDKNEKDVALKLLNTIKKARTQSATLSIRDIITKLELRTDYGALYQEFEIDDKFNVIQNDEIDELADYMKDNNKIIIVGEPGSGKSWFIQNTINYLSDQDIKFAKHYCFVSTEDDLQVERIKTNIFYGNLISDIIGYFPEIKDYKITPYGADLDELNHIISMINEDFYIFIDGLDHIGRVYDKNSGILAGEEIEIIDKVSRIEAPKNVRIILGTQPIKDIDKLMQSGYKEILIPKWGQERIESLLDNYGVENSKLNSGNKISEILLEKSKGNPLYLSYLIKTIKNMEYIEEASIGAIPPYDYNLSAYYSYLLTKLSSEKIALIFAGIEFSVTEEEINEISGLGQLTTDSINVLLPILRQNYSTGGFSIYHESFRRYILEKLQNSGVKVEIAVYKDVIDWLENKGFYQNPKAYKHLMSLLFESKRYDDIKLYINTEFYANSLVYGYDMESIKSNYKVFVKTVEATNDWAKFILISEISRNIYSFNTSDSYSSYFELYFQAIFCVKGLDAARNILIYEGEAALDVEYGLKGCYFIDSDNFILPWNEYIELLPEKIPLASYKYFLRGEYRISGKEFFKEHIEAINHKRYQTYINIFVEEYTDLFGIEDMLNVYSNLSKNKDIWSKAINKYIDNHILPIRHRINGEIKRYDSIDEDILLIEHVYEETVAKLEAFIDQIKYFAQYNPKSIEEFLDKIQYKNWFSNWVIFTCEYFIIKDKWLKGEISQEELENQLADCYKLLASDTEPFKGKPRTCDLHYGEPLIFNVIREPLQLIQSLDCWVKVFEYLKNIAVHTTTSLQGSKGGPLTPDKLFDLMLEFNNPANIDHFIALIEEISSDEEDYGLYSYYANYELHKAILYTKKSYLDKADHSLLKAVQYMAAYGERKDITLLELLDSIDSLFKINKDAANLRIRDLKLLCDAAADHTDGSETKWFPIHWYKHYIKNCNADALLYLVNSLKKVQIDWRLEDSIVDALQNIKDIINPEITTYIFRTFPMEISAQFVESYIENVSNLYNSGKMELARKAFSDLKNRFYKNENYEFNDEIKQKISLYEDIFRFNKNSFFKHSQDYNYGNVQNSVWWKKCEYGADLGNAPISEAILQIKKFKFPEDQLRLKYYIEQFNELTDEFKVVLRSLLDTYEMRNLQCYFEEIFDDLPINADIKIYSYVCLFSYSIDGWGNNFINVGAFKKAVSLDTDKALTYLSHILRSFLYEPSYNSKVASNLINAFTECGIDEATITNMWENAFNMINYRLPNNSQYNWDENIQNTMSLDNDEITICLLLVRLKHPELKRQKWTLTGISYLLYNYPDRLIKPLKWFFTNNSDFMDVSVISVLQIIYDYHFVDNSYAKNFKEELISLVPSHSFMKDYIISTILNLEAVKYVDLQKVCDTDRVGLNYEKEFTNNYRNRYLTQCGFDLKPTIAKYIKSVSEKGFRKRVGQMFFNQMNSTLVHNVSFQNEWIKLINIDLLGFINNTNRKKFDLESLFINTSLDLKTIVAYQNSLSLRPDIPLPKEVDMNDHCIIVNDGWATIAHYEQQIEFEGGYPKKENFYKSFGGIVFGWGYKFPYSDYQINSKSLWEHLKLRFFRMERQIILSNIKHDGLDELEKMNLLWLYPQMLEMLGLTTISFNEGIQAKDKKGDIVLKLNCWECDFLGYERLTDEVAKLEGAQLLMREDYFNKLCTFYNDKPQYLKFVP